MTKKRLTHFMCFKIKWWWWWWHKTERIL